MRFGAGFLGNIGSLKIDGNQKYSHINFKFYYPTLKIGYKYTKMKIDNYDGWYSDLTTSGVYFEISKSF